MYFQHLPLGKVAGAEFVMSLAFGAPGECFVGPNCTVLLLCFLYSNGLDLLADVYNSVTNVFLLTPAMP